MDGYFKPKLKGRIKELRPLELKEIEYVSEDDEIDHDFSEAKDGRLHTCPRCEAITRLETRDPYCPECNWDSLTDLINRETKKCGDY